MSSDDGIAPRAAGYVRRARRRLDVSQRELGQLLSLSAGRIANIEAGRSRVGLREFEAILAAAGLSLRVVDSQGHVIEPMSEDCARDHAGRRFGAHLDVVARDDDRWPYYWGAGPRRDRPRNPAQVAARLRRDERRSAEGVPDDHVSDRECQARLAEIAEDRRRRTQEQRLLAAARRGAVQAPPEECDCPVACYGGSSCVDECVCQCGG